MSGVEGKKYRRDVISGFFYEPKNPLQNRFETLGELQAARSGGNIIRDIDHYEPYDLKRDFSKPENRYIKELSEHAVLNIWMAFWFRVAVLTAKDIIDRDMTRLLFKDWYVSWFDFMNQFRFVGEYFYKDHVGRGYGGDLVKALAFLESDDVFGFERELADQAARNREIAENIYRSIFENVDEN